MRIVVIAWMLAGLGVVPSCIWTRGPVATAIQNATFAKTQSGGSFRYPFAF